MEPIQEAYGHLVGWVSHHQHLVRKVERLDADITFLRSVGKEAEVRVMHGETLTLKVPTDMLREIVDRRRHEAAQERDKFHMKIMAAHAAGSSK